MIMRRGATLVIANLSDQTASVSTDGSILAASDDGVVVEGNGCVMPSHSLAVVGLMDRPLVGTYRLQLRPGFGFARRG